MKDDKTKKPLTDEQLDEANGGFLVPSPASTLLKCNACGHVWRGMYKGRCPKCDAPNPERTGVLEIKW